MELSVELGRIEITFQPYLLQLAQLLDYPFREIQGVSAEVNQRQQLLHIGEVTLYLVHILVELGAFFLPNCLNLNFYCVNLLVFFDYSSDIP